MTLASRIRTLQAAPAFKELPREERVAVLTKINLAELRGDAAAIDEVFRLYGVGDRQFAAQPRSMAAITAPANKQRPALAPPTPGLSATQGGHRPYAAGTRSQVIQAPGGQKVSPTSRNLGRTMTERDIVNVLTGPEVDQRSVLRAHAAEFAKAMVEESARTGIPAWFVLAIMKRENNFDTPVRANGTLHANRTIFQNGKVVGKGCPYNIGGVTTANVRTGKYIIVPQRTPGGRMIRKPFRVYDSPTEAIQDEYRILGNIYRGLPCYGGPGVKGTFIETYSPHDENSNASQDEFFRIIRTYGRLYGGLSGKNGVKGSTVVVPTR
jgi:hypothetical protein